MNERVFVDDKMSRPLLPDEDRIVVCYLSQNDGSDNYYNTILRSKDGDWKWQIVLCNGDDNNEYYLTGRIKRSLFMDRIILHYPEDLEFFLWHPEIFDGRYDK